MTDASLSEALKEAYASADSEIIICIRWSLGIRLLLMKTGSLPQSEWCEIMLIIFVDWRKVLLLTLDKTLSLSHGF